MAKVSILGLADTRLLTMCIARGFMIDGKTIIVTDDTSYKRLMVIDYEYEGEDTFGRLDDIDILVDINLKSKVKGASIESYINTTIDGMGETYKNIVFVSDEVFDKTNGFTIICKSNEDTFDSAIKSCNAVQLAMEEKNMHKEDSEKPEALKRGAIPVVEIEIKSATKGKSVESGNILRLSGAHLAWLLEIEENKKIPVLKDSAMLGTIDNIVGDGCGMGSGKLLQFMTRSYIAE